MKSNIHPKYYHKSEVTCACGNKFQVGSTKPSIKVEICSLCHPFYTGANKFIDKAGRVDKFQAKMDRFEEIQKDKFRKMHKKVTKQKQAEELLRSRKK